MRSWGSRGKSENISEEQADNDESALLGAALVKGLVVVAEDSLIVEAIAIGLRRSGDFNLLAHLDPRSATAQRIIDANPDVVLLDEMESPDQMIELIRQIKSERESIAVIMLTLAPDQAAPDDVFAAGATAVVSKATPPLALATLIRETTAGHLVHPYKPGDSRDALTGTSATDDSLLSGREREVLYLVAAGSTNGEIARKLWVTEQTVKFHLSRIYRKLGVANRTEASNYAHVHGLLRSGESATAS